jgi:HAD superfamily hydrolase (TIGR01549 family)
MGAGLAMAANARGTILFDWGDTLVRIPGIVHTRKAHLACVRTVFYDSTDEAARPRHRSGAAVPWEQFRRVYEAVSLEHIARSLNTGREHRFEDRFAETLRRLNAEPAPSERQLNDLVLRLSREILAGAELLDGADEVIPRLTYNYRLGIVSNYPFAPLVAQTLERFGLRDHFDAIVVSGEIGWCKPYPHPFQEALRRLGAQPRSTLFVGDDIANDLRGAKALGFATVWYAPGKPKRRDPSIDLQIADLRDLLSWDRHAAAR